MELQELINLKNRFDKYLQPGDYSFIGPENQIQINEFVQTANLIGPSNIFSTTFKQALGDHETIMKTIARFPTDTHLRIYVIIGKVEKAGIFMHSTIEEYCKRYKISFE